MCLACQREMELKYDECELRISTLYQTLSDEEVQGMIQGMIRMHSIVKTLAREVVKSCLKDMPYREGVEYRGDQHCSNHFVPLAQVSRW